MAFAPPKTGNQNSLQLSFMKDGTTRHIYVYHEDPEVITNWYLAIRCAKLHRLQVAYPGASENELLSQLTRDFPREGFLWKTGPRHTDAYKKRWFTLDGRKLMYHDDPMVCPNFYLSIVLFDLILIIFIVCIIRLYRCLSLFRRTRIQRVKSFWDIIPKALL